MANGSLGFESPLTWSSEHHSKHLSLDLALYDSGSLKAEPILNNSRSCINRTSRSVVPKSNGRWRTACHCSDVETSLLGSRSLQVPSSVVSFASLPSCHRTITVLQFMLSDRLRELDTMASGERPLHLLSLPYDIRWLIYSQLFPQSNHIYLIAHKEGLHHMLAEGSLPMHIFSVSRQMNMEAGEFLYNSYLFNVIGHKKHCIDHYRSIFELLDRYARDGADVDVLDNGLLSVTACVSMFARGGNIEAMARSRQRGARRDLHEVEAEARNMVDLPELPSQGPQRRTPTQFWQWFFAYMLGRLERSHLFASTAVLALCIAVWAALLYQESA